MTIEEELKGRFRSEYHKGAINLIYTARLLSYEFSHELRNNNLTEPQYNVLRVLRGFMNEGPSSIGFLKERMLDKYSDVSRIVDKLLSKELVVRKENCIDRRQKDIEITEKGMLLLKKLDDNEKKTDSFLKNLNSEEVKELNRILDKVRD